MAVLHAFRIGLRTIAQMQLLPSASVYEQRSIHVEDDFTTTTAAVFSNQVASY